MKFKRMNKKGAIGFLERALLLYLCLAIVSAFIQPQVIFGDSEQGRNLLTFFNINTYNTTTNEPILPQKLALNTDVNAQEGNLFSRGFQFISSAFQWVIDVVLNTIGYIALFFRVMFSPFIIFTSPAMQGIPTILIFVMVFPLIFLFLYAIIGFIRGYS
jgi:hypothetical protein